MNILEYAEDVSKDVSEIISLCAELGIHMSSPFGGVVYAFALYLFTSNSCRSAP